MGEAMYRLTPRMRQRLIGDLAKYHGLFNGGRCSGWELEELIVAAITSDTRAQHHVRWQEAGHDDKADYRCERTAKHTLFKSNLGVRVETGYGFLDIV